MGKQYKGNSSAARLAPEIMDPCCTLLVNVAPQNVHMFTNIMEGFSHLAWVTTYSAQENTLAILATLDTIDEIRKILSAPPCSEIAEIVEVPGDL